MENFMDKIVKTSSINNIIDIYFELVQNDYNIILVSDIDDTILSSKIGKKFVENNVKTLIEHVYNYNPDNLIFLTARDYDYKRKTNHQLNSARMHKKGKYIDYNIIFSPDNHKGEPTKGDAFIHYFENGKGKQLLKSDKKIWILFIDDLISQVLSVHSCINKLENINYTLFHYEFS